MALEPAVFNLETLGWGPAFAQAFEALGDKGLVPARISAEHRHQYEVLTVEGACRGQLRGALLVSGDPPSVGDWVAVRRTDGTLAIIEHLLPRRTALIRRAAGTASQAQVLAANVDVVFVLTSLNRDFNPRRVERILAAVEASGADGVVVLTKADLCDAPEAFAARVRHETVVCVSALEGRNLDALEPWLQPGGTVALVGSSGVGKSTLCNALLGVDRIAVREIRASDDRGVHATTHRQLLVLPSGAALIDSPGIRELQLWEGDEALREVFDDIDALAPDCRFRDCQHVDQPGCAVVAAVERGELEPGRVTNWHKLSRQLEHEADRLQTFKRRADKRAFTKLTRHVQARKRRGREWKS